MYTFSLFTEARTGYVALIGLELIVQIHLASTCSNVILLSAGSTGMCYETWLTETREMVQTGKAAS